MSRIYTNKLWDMVENGLVSHESALNACLRYMSEDDVKDMMECNEMIEEEEEEEEEELN
jgi:hypothetical protein